MLLLISETILKLRNSPCPRWERRGLINTVSLLKSKYLEFFILAQISFSGRGILGFY
jgi:hypothetical protein